METTVLDTRNVCEQSQQDPVQQIRKLKLMKSLLKVEGAWTKGAYARDSGGSQADSDDVGACSFCVYGADHKVGHDIPQLRNVRVLYLLNQYARANGAAMKLKYDDIMTMNDHPATKKEDILRAIDWAIEQLEVTIPKQMTFEQIVKEEISELVNP